MAQFDIVIHDGQVIDVDLPKDLSRQSVRAARWMPTSEKSAYRWLN